MSVPLHRAPWRSTRRLALWSVAALLAIAMVALLAACGSSSSSSSSSSSPSASPTASATTAAAPWTAADLAAVTTDPSLKAMLPSSIVSANNLRVASDIPWPPWEYYVSPTSKQVTGLDYDLSQGIGKKIGIPTSFLETPFDTIILAIKGGRRDMIMSAMGDSAAREKSGITYIDYAWDGTSFLVPKGNPKGITNPDSLAGQTVACEEGTTQQSYLLTWNAQFKKAGKKPMTIITLPNGPAAVLAVSSGRAVAYVSDRSTIEYTAKMTNNGNTFEVVTDPAAPSGYFSAPDGIGIAASNTALVTTVQKALQDLINEGSYQKIVESYGVAPVTSAQINQGSKKHPVGLPVSASTAP